MQVPATPEAPVPALLDLVERKRSLTLRRSRAQGIEGEEEEAVDPPLLCDAEYINALGEWCNESKDVPVSRTYNRTFVEHRDGVDEIMSEQDRVFPVTRLAPRSSESIALRMLLHGCMRPGTIM